VVVTAWTIVSVHVFVTPSLFGGICLASHQKDCRRKSGVNSVRDVQATCHFFEMYTEDGIDHFDGGKEKQCQP
jgi:hypothetical protein